MDFFMRRFLQSFPSQRLELGQRDVRTLLGTRELAGVDADGDEVYGEKQNFKFHSYLI